MNQYEVMYILDSSIEEGSRAHPAHGSCSPPHLPFPVRYRVFALDQKMRPASDILTVTVEVSPRPLTFLMGQGC